MDKETRGAKGRISAADWRHAALEEIARSGVKKLSIEKIARDLNVAKSSFYWHFKDRDTLLMSCLRSWERFVVDDFEDYILEKGLSGREALIEGTKTVLYSRYTSAAPGGALEIAFKIWGDVDDRARAAVRRVARRRIKLLRKFYAELGVPETKTIDWANLWLAFMTGQAVLVGIVGSKDLRQRVDFAIAKLVDECELEMGSKNSSHTGLAQGG